MLELPYRAFVIQGVVNLPSQFRKGGGAIMSTYEVLTLLFLFGTFLIALLTYIDHRNNKRK